MQCCTSHGRVVLGGCCPRNTFHRGGRSMAIFSDGAKWESGKKCTTRCGRGYANWQDDTNIRQREALTGRASKPLPVQGSRVLTRERKSRVASDIFSSTPWDC